jgi:hypothetical protein
VSGGGEEPHPRDVVETGDCYLEGPRWRLPASTLHRDIIDHNAMLNGLGLPGVEILDAREFTTLTRRTLVFRLRGPRYSVDTFIEALDEMVRANHGGVIRPRKGDAP